MIVTGIDRIHEVVMFHSGGGHRVGVLQVDLHALVRRRLVDLRAALNVVAAEAIVLQGAATGSDEAVGIREGCAVLFERCAAEVAYVFREKQSDGDTEMAVLVSER